MDNKPKYAGSKQEAGPKQARNTVLLNMSAKRLERKPSTRMLQSPKSRFTDFQNFSELEDNPNSLRLEPSQKSINSGSFTLDNLTKNFCYLSPKNSKVTSIFTSPKRIFTNRQEQLSIEQIETKEIIQLDLQLSPPVKLQNSKKRTLSRTSNFSQTNKVIHTRDRNQDQTSSQAQKPEGQIKYFKTQNSELKVVNAKLNERVHDLKQQNQYLYKQIEELNKLMAVQKRTNEQLIMLNDCLNDKIEGDQKHIEQFKMNYKTQQVVNKNYQVLQHMFKKLKYEHSTISEKNRQLQLQNQKLGQKVNSLLKMLDEYPIKPKKQRSKSKSRQLSPVYNKENCSASNQTIRISNFDIKTPKNHNKSKRSESFFELSPE